MHNLRYQNKQKEMKIKETSLDKQSLHPNKPTHPPNPKKKTEGRRILQKRIKEKRCRQEQKHF